MSDAKVISVDVVSSTELSNETVDFLSKLVLNMTYHMRRTPTTGEITDYIFATDEEREAILVNRPVQDQTEGFRPYRRPRFQATHSSYYHPLGSEGAYE